MVPQTRLERVAQFRHDLELLRERYALGVIAKEMDMDAGNLSRYHRGAKDPGEVILEKFYARFGDAVRLLRANYAESNSVAESPVAYGAKDQSDEISQLRSRIDTLNEAIEKLTETNRILVDSLQKIAETNLLLAKKG